MSAQIIPFTYTSDSTVRTVVIDGEPLFKVPVAAVEAYMARQAIAEAS